MYCATATPLTTWVYCVGLIQLDVAPRPPSTLAKPHWLSPDTLIKELVEAVPVVNFKLLVAVSYDTFTPETMEPVKPF